ncbi:MAG: hypothetical protein E7616_02590 [Ruminococcaceae bacterium]|nr:hypothetical protein [Oscillospiraceae bacterium]
MARTITNYATLDYLSGSVLGTAISNIAQATIRETLSITKDAYRASYRRGEIVTYIIQIIARDSAPSSLVVADDLGTYTLGGISYTPLEYISYLLYVGQTLNPAQGGVNVDVTPQTNGVRFAFDNLPNPFPGLTLIVQARVNEYAPMDRENGSITNTSQLILGGAAVSGASVTIEAEQYADLRIIKSMTPDPVTEGSTLTYTFVICNYGTQAPTEVTLRDSFVPGPRIPLTVMVDGAAVDAFDYNSATGSFVMGSGASEPYTLAVPAAVYERDPVTGAVTVNPGTTTVSVSGIIGL